MKVRVRLTRLPLGTHAFNLLPVANFCAVFIADMISNGSTAGTLFISRQCRKFIGRV